MNAASDYPYNMLPETYGPLNKLADEIHKYNVEAGWWDVPDKLDKNFAAVKISLIHSEVSECLEGIRKGLMDDHLKHRSMEEVEAADIIIRLLDLAGARGWNLDEAVQEKREYNKQRADHKKENRSTMGGKAF